MSRIEYIVPFSGTETEVIDDNEIKIEFEEHYETVAGDVHQNMTPSPNTNIGDYSTTTATTNDWKLNSNVECRIILEKLNTTVPTFPIKMEYDVCDDEGGYDGETVGLSSTPNRGQLTTEPNVIEAFQKLKQLLDDLCKVFDRCELNCDVCYEYIHKLTQHFLTVHEKENPQYFVPENIKEEKTVIAETDTDATGGMENNEADPLSDYVIDPEHESESSGKAMDVNVRKSDCRVIGCRFCTKTFPSIQEYESHFKMHEPEDPYKCKVCGKTFNYSNLFEKHISSHVGLYQCTTCNIGFRLKSDLDVHTLKFCDSNTQVKSLHTGESHKLLHTRENHKLLHTGEKLNEYKCEICNMSFLTLTWFDHHNIEFHRGEKEKPYRCKVCDERFLVPHQLTSHMKVHNKEQKPYKCETCGKDFLWLNSLKTHNMSHTQVQTGEKGLLHKCEICGKEFEGQQHLIKHKNLHNYQGHGNKFLLKCDPCELYFENRHELNLHEKCHAVEDTHNCETCGKEFLWLETLQIHRQSHTGENS